MKGLEKSALSVSAVAFFISDLIKDHLGSILIKGEISNLQLRSHSSYIRFSLKDNSAKIDCLTFNQSNASKLLSHLKNGDEVIAFANPNFYKKTGQFSFFIDEMMKLGDGIFQNNLEKLKQNLYQEGLFDPSRKKKLPPYPSHIGVVTSADGAALQDILRVANDRYPCLQVSVFPSLVQGKDAPKSLVKALTCALRHSLDVIIIGRGGGSSEDLEAFNDESLVRLIAQASIPIVSAVGHEIDTSLTDYVADVSAPTPTGAAMMVLPDKEELLKELQNAQSKLRNGIRNYINHEKRTIQLLKEKLILTYEKYLSKERQNLNRYRSQLQELNPYKVIDKGYAWIGGQELEEGKEISILTKTQTIQATITKIKENLHE